MKPPSASESILPFIEPVIEGDVLVMDEAAEGVTEWEKKIVGFFLDKKLPFNTVKEEVRKHWKLRGDIEVALDGDIFYFTVYNEEDRRDILKEGSIIIAKKTLVIRPWSKEIEENRGSITKVPIWVKFYNGIGGT
ncbi:hypothetical protein ACHQM5_025444 [Ranunculus cassubicifolius]